MSALGSEFSAPPLGDPPFHPGGVPSVPFDWILGEAMGRSGQVDFLLPEAADCPHCRKPVTEMTLVEPR